MTGPNRHFTVVSDFNATPLARLLGNVPELATATIEVAPFNQVYQSLSSPPTHRQEVGVIWTLPERACPTFARVLDLEEVEFEDCLAEVDEFAERIVSFAADRDQCFVACWAKPIGHRGYGLLDWRPGVGIANLIARMNLRLAERLAAAKNVCLLDSMQWFLGVDRPTAPKMWYAAKVPFAAIVFERAAADIVAAIQARSGQSRRLVIVDLDNTLWGGVVGETGWQGIRLGGIDLVGEAYRDFQKALLSLSNRGIQLAISSKNDEVVALEAIDNHPEMMLRRQHFAGWRINWSDKAQNIVDLVDELNLGLGSVVFIDDNVAERERIRSALPQILVPDWPADPTEYVSALWSLKCFDTATISSEDRNRTAMYVAERERREKRRTVASLDDWLLELAMRIEVRPLSQATLPRVIQLLNKTNQLNLSTRRLSEAELLDWATAPNRRVLAISVSDRFGDNGLVGIVSFQVEGVVGQIFDFVLSCRAMGRRVEDAMLYLAISELREMGAASVRLRYLQTSRNGPTLQVLRKMHLEEVEPLVFAHDCASEFKAPPGISIEMPDSR
jgi:FkbH-like protein